MICIKCKLEIPDESIYCLRCGKKQTAPSKTRKPRARGNGMGTVYKRGRTWTVEVRVGMKIDPTTGEWAPDRRTKGGFSTKTEALSYVPVLKAETPVEQRRPITTLAVLWDNYSKGAMLKLSRSKQGHFKTAYKKLAAIANRPIASLTIGDLQDLVDEKAETFYPAKDMKTLLCHLYKRAAAQQDVATNLAEYIVLPDLEEGEPNPFNEEELKKLWKDYGDGHKLTGYILLMIYSGMMPGELFKAEKSMIDWGKQQIVGCGLKTKKRKETPLVVANMIVPVLQDLCDYSKTDKLLDMRRDLFYDEFHVVLARCGIDDRRPYDCRHTTATALALGNIAPAVIQEIMRHTKFTTTQRYIHTEVDTVPMINAINQILDSNVTEEGTS